MRHGLVVVLTATVCAVAAGARSLVAIAEWVADLPDEVAARWGPIGRARRNRLSAACSVGSTPTGSTGVLGGFVQRLCAGATPAARRRVLAMVSDAATREGLTKLGDNLV